MKEREGVVNINFFKKVWYSITKFEQYPAMATEGLPRAIRYLLTLMIAVTIFVMIGSLMQMKQTIDKLSQYIEQNIPDFTITDGKVDMNIEQPIKIEDIQYSGIDKIIINPLAETTEQKEQSENDETIVGVTIFFFKDEIILKSKIDDDHVTKQNYTYGEFVSNYTGENISTFNKTQLVEYLTSQGMTKYYVRYGLSAFVYLFLINRKLPILSKSIINTIIKVITSPFLLFFSLKSSKSKLFVSSLGRSVPIPPILFRLASVSLFV